MQNIIKTLVAIAKESPTLEISALSLSKIYPQFGKKASMNVMVDVLDFINEDIDEISLSLFLVDHGFVEKVN